MLDKLCKLMMLGDAVSVCRQVEVMKCQLERLGI